MRIASLLVIWTMVSATVSLLGLSAGAATAQVAWDTPYLVPPQVRTGVGVYLVETAGGDLGAMATQHNGLGPHNLGWRIGVAKGAGDKPTVYAGVDVSGPWRRASAAMVPDVAWIGGFGAAAGDYLLLSIPFGITIGRTLTGEGELSFRPYLSPRFILDAAMGRKLADGRESGELDLDLTLDLGIDVAFPGQWEARFGATLGDREGIAVGVVF